MKKDICIVGIAGGSASGKTTIVNNIKELFQNDIELISHDNYYLSNDDKTMEERVKLNYDHPSSFDTYEIIYRPVYDYTQHTRAKEVVEVHPKKVIILEGILILEDPRLRDLMDIKVFVDTDADERLMRRILRDTQERGRTVESVLNQYVTTVKPMHEQFVEPSKKYADIIMPEGGHNQVAIDIVISKIRSQLNLI